MKKYFFIALVALFYACKSGQVKESIQDPDYNLMNDSVDVYGLHYTDESFLQLFDSISLIKLETNENCYLGTIRDIIIDDEKLIVIDGSKSKQIVVFDITGNYSHHIGSMGKGPGEYLSLFSVDYTDRELIVYDNWGQKVILYAVSGEIIKQSMLKTYPNAISKISDNNFACYFGNIERNDHIVTICDSTYEKKSSFFPFQNDKVLPVGVPWIVKNKDKNSFLFFQSYSNNIYEINTKTNTSNLHHKILINPVMEYDVFLKEVEGCDHKEYLEKKNRSNVGCIHDYYELLDSSIFINLYKNGALYISRLDNKNGLNNVYKVYDAYPKLSYFFNLNGRIGNQIIYTLDKYFYNKLPKDLQEELLELIPSDQRTYFKTMSSNDNPIVLLCNLKKC